MLFPALTQRKEDKNITDPAGPSRPSPPLQYSDVSGKVCGHQFISFRAFCLLYPNFGIPGAQIQPTQFGVHFLEGPKEDKPTTFVFSYALRKAESPVLGESPGSFVAHLCHRGVRISPWELGGSDSRVPYPKGQCWMHLEASGSHPSSAQLCDLGMKHNLHQLCPKWFLQVFLRCCFYSQHIPAVTGKQNCR